MAVPHSEPCRGVRHFAEEHARQIKALPGDLHVVDGGQVLVAAVCSWRRVGRRCRRFQLGGPGAVRSGRLLLVRRKLNLAYRGTSTHKAQGA